MTSTFQGLVATYDTIRSIDSATFTGAYQAVGTPLTFPVRIFKFVNMSTVPVAVSLDGVHQNDIVPANSYTLYDVTTNKVNIQGFATYALPVGTQFYVNASAGTGLFYIVCIGS